MQSSVKIRHGLFYFLITLLVMGFAGYFAQIHFGLFGLAVTEILILVMALIPVIIHRLPFKDVFPVAIPKSTHLLGATLIWLGSYIWVILVTQITLYFFPEGLMAVSSDMSDFFSSTTMIVALLIVAFMPALCEEMLHRGFIYYTVIHLSTVKRILFMGLIFGIFHLDPYRFLPTALLGMALTYVMIASNNLIIPMWMHLINNALAVYFAFQGGSATAISSNETLLAISSFLILAALTPPLFLLGVKCFKGSSFKLLALRRILVSVAISFVFMMGGIILMFQTNWTAPPLFVTHMTMSVGHDSAPHDFLIDVEKTGTYHVDLAMTIQDGLGRVLIKDSMDTVIFELTARELTLTQDLEMTQGQHCLTVDFLFDTPLESEVPFVFSMTIQ